MGRVELSRLVRQAREQAGVSLRELSEDTGVAVSHLHRLEHGRVVEPAPSTLRKVAGPLGVPYMSLMREAGYL